VHKLKKYPNRRLYDSTVSKYVTIKDVRKLISDGESIVVEDSNDGSDLTRSVLMQILSEQEAEGREPILTNRAIEMIIRLYSVRMGRVLSRYVEQSLLTFFNNQDRFRTRMRELNEMNPLAMMRNMMESSWGSRPSRSSRDESKRPESDDS
jgi:polyhydroxyalkanoate synthesis repressor PhaR